MSLFARPAPFLPPTQPTSREAAEVGSTMPYGPNHDEVKALLAECREMTDAQRNHLAAAWDSGDNEFRREAWRAAHDHAQRDSDRWEAYQTALADAGPCYLYGATPEGKVDLVSGPAYDAMDAAILALVVKDLIGKAHFRRLYEPWSTATSS
jgi:hypothetical protein